MPQTVSDLRLGGWKSRFWCRGESNGSFADKAAVRFRKIYDRFQTNG